MYALVSPRSPLTSLAGAAIALFVAGTCFAGPAPRAARAPARWVAATPDEMLDVATARARSGVDDADRAAGLATAYALAPRASAGRARELLASLASLGGEVGWSASWLAAALDPSPSPRAPGLVRAISVLGPFHDEGGGLARREGPEAAGQRFGDPDASYAWGAYEVRWRALPEAVVSPRGVPLALVVQPRAESCSYLASVLDVPTRMPVVVRVAAAGAVRLGWDAGELARDADVHEGALFDRVAARVDASAGPHLVWLKVCSGTRPDDGHVRLTLSDATGKPLELRASPLTAAFAPRASTDRATRLATLLASASSPRGEHPSTSAALDAAAVRALGLADDLRSPRAPGWLDRVASDATASADALAMAGFVTPFGAERSSRLDAALARALAGGDRATASFCQRRLAVGRVNAGLADWALASIGHAPLADEHDAEADLVRAMARAALGSEGAKREALGALEAVAAKQGPRASLALTDELADLASGFDAARELEALERGRALAPERVDARLARATARRDLGALEKLVGEAIEGGAAARDEDAIGVAEAALEAGLWPVAAKAFEATSRLAPNAAPAFGDLAEALRAVGDHAGADRALARLRALDPGDVAARAEQAWRERTLRERDAARSGEGARSGARPRPRDEASLVAPEVFLARRAAHPAVRGEIVDRQLHWLRAVSMQDDRRVSQLIHYAREIVIEPRTKDELYEPIPLEGGDQFEIVRARVLRAAGGIAFAEEEHVDSGRPVVRWPDLATGDVVEVAVRTYTSEPVGRRGDPPWYFMDVAGGLATHPVLYNEVVVDSPLERPIALDVLHGKADRATESVENGRRVTRLVWDAPTNVADEPLAPKPTETVPTVVGSTFGSWDEFRTWYQAAVEGFTEPDEEVRRLAAELTRGKRGRDEKVRALFEYVADDIRYVNYVSGEWWLPNRPQELLARRQGDCDDKALLLITLLRAVGLRATEVLVQTRMTGQPALLGSKRAAVPLFDHGIAYLPGERGAPGLWLDATSPESRLGPLPSMDARAVALFATEGPAEVRETPRSAPVDHGVDAAWRIALEPDGAGRLEADETHVGDHAFFLRGALREKDARAAWVEQNLLGGQFPSVALGDAITFEPDLARGAARVRYSARSDAMARREGVDLVVPISPAQTLASRLAPLVRRTLPVVLPSSLAPSHQTRVVRIVAPAGFRVAELPPGGEEDGGPFGRATLSIARDPRDGAAVRVERSVVFDMSPVPVEQYAAWRAWLERVDALVHRSIRFTPTTTPEGAGASR